MGPSAGTQTLPKVAVGVWPQVAQVGLVFHRRRTGLYPDENTGGGQMPTGRLC